MKPIIFLLALASLASADRFVEPEPDATLYYDSLALFKVEIGPSACMLDSAGVMQPCDCEEIHPCYASLFYEGLRHPVILSYVAAEGDWFEFAYDFPVPNHPPSHVTLTLYDWHNTPRGGIDINLEFRDPKPTAVARVLRHTPVTVARRHRLDGRRW